MNQCPKCGASASTDQLFCNNCGFSFTVSPAAAKHKKKKIYLWYLKGLTLQSHRIEMTLSYS
ncbi:zinc ribbon domain-containing protein [Priestia megaterium]